MKKVFLLLAASALIPMSVMAQTIPNARYTNKDGDGIVYERGVAENQLKFAKHGVPMLGIIDLEVFKVKVPLNQTKKAKKIIDTAIKRATGQTILMNVGYSENQQHMGDIDMGNGVRSGIFIGGIEKTYKVSNPLKSDTAFLSLPATYDQNDTNSVVMPDATRDYLSGFKIKVKMDSSKTDPQKNASFEVEVKTKADTSKEVWTTDSYKLSLKPGEQQFFYTLPKADKKSDKAVDVYVFALYPYVRSDYYSN